MAQDLHQQAIERFDDAADFMRENYERMREDMRFSNPADPQQWDDDAKTLRRGRPCLTFDRTNQFIAQVVNSQRQAQPSINVMPADSSGDVDVAEKLSGIVRHVEYVSRAAIAYDTAMENAARVGIGWMRVLPEVMRPETNEQEIRIKRVHDPLSCYLEAGWADPDGSDATHGFVETMLTKRAFKAKYPKAKDSSWEGNQQVADWFGDQVRICEYFTFEDTETNSLIVDIDGQQVTMTEQEYWQLAAQIGFKPAVVSSFMATNRTVKWAKLSGVEVLEETEFPSRYIPLVPVIGHEVWVDGKRYLCGMTRRLMDSQRAYNYERSAFVESVAMQPKAPYMAPVEALEGHEDAWRALNSGNPAVLTYNALDPEGNTIPAPARQMPPPFPVAFAQGGQIASQDMESAVGMFRANLGQGVPTAVSGRAKREDKVAGETATYHYSDNLSRSIEHLGRIVVDMIPRVYNTQRQARIVSDDGSQDFVGIDPDMKQPLQREKVRGTDAMGNPTLIDGQKIVAINPSVGAYDVRVKTGPAYTTLREESAEQLANLFQASPQLVPILGDIWVSMQDWPQAEKAAKRLAMMLPPQIQHAEADGGAQVPPEVAQQMAQMQQQMQQLQQQLQQAQAEGDAVRQRAAEADMQHRREIAKLHVDNYRAETERMRLQLDAQALHAPDGSNADTSIQVANIRAEASKDVAAIGALTQLEIAGMQPDPELQAEIADDEAGDD